MLSTRLSIDAIFSTDNSYDEFNSAETPNVVNKKINAIKLFIIPTLFLINILIY